MHLLRFIFTAALLCQAGLVQAKDIAGGKDHPVLSRYAGSQLDGYQEIGFGAGVFYLPQPDQPGKELLRDEPVRIEGKVTRLLYLAPKGKSPLEVHRNYEQALKAAGASIKTSVDGSNAWWEPGQHWNKQFTELKFQGKWAPDISPFGREGLYVYGELKRAGSTWHISVLTAQVFGEEQPQAAVAVQIIEPQAMVGGQVTVNADAMKQALGAEGKIALYGIYFDTGKAELKAESKAQLEQMAKLLREQAALKVFIVGHTDNQGAFDANLSLSQHRAEAVVSTLIKDYQIAAHRLQAKAAASIAPIASNANEAGRAKNRRVELVAQ